MAESSRLRSLATEERTPFLSVHQGESSTQQESGEQDVTNLENVQTSGNMSQMVSFIKSTTYCLLASSVVCLIVLLTAFLTNNLSPYSRYSWEADHITSLIAQLGLFMFFSIILSILNLGTLLYTHRHPPPTTNLLYLTPRTTFFWLPLSLLIDLLFAVSIACLAAVLSGWASLPGYCRDDDHGDPKVCEQWRLSLRILFAIGIAVSVIVGLSYLLLFILRSITAFRSGLWFRPTRWNLPVKGLTVQLTVKLLGVEGEEDGGNGD